MRCGLTASRWRKQIPVRQRLPVQLQDLIAAADADLVGGAARLDGEHEQLGRRQPGLVAPVPRAVEDRDRDDHRRRRALDLDVRERHRRIAAAQVADPQRRRAGVLDGLGELRPGRDGGAVDRGDEVEGLQPGLRRRRVGIEHADLGQVKARRHADPADGLLAPQRPRALDLHRRDVALLGVGAAADPEAQRVPERIGDHALQVLPVADLLAVDGLDAIAGHEAGLGRRQVGQHRADDRRQQRALPGVVHEVDQQRQQQIERRPGDDDRVALPQWLVGQRALALAIDGRDRVAGILAQQAHVAAERHQRQAVLGLAARDAKQARPEADREAHHAHVEQLGEHEVPELVHQDQHAEQRHDRRRPEEQAHRARAPASWAATPVARCLGGAVGA